MADISKRPLLGLRLVFVTGKGGVGKTTVAAALAELAAKAGQRTLICEMDDKGAVADAFGRDAGVVMGHLAVVLEAILPFYGPFRQQLLAAEGDLARQLTPILQRWASTPQAVCFVAWQAQIIRNAKGRPTVASLARPGERILFSPEGKAVRFR